MLDTYIKWFESHERLLLVALVMGLGVWGWNHYVDKSAETAKVNAGVKEQIAQAQQESDAKVAAAVAAMQAQFNAQQAQRDQEIATLIAAIAKRDTVTIQRVTEVKQIKDPGPAVQALVNAYPMLPAPMVETADGADVPVADLNEFTATKIEHDTLVRDVKDRDVIIEAKTASFDQLVGVKNSLVDQVSGLRTEIKTNNDACEAEKKSLKADARKSKWHLFWWGYGAGFASREAIKHIFGF